MLRKHNKLIMLLVLVTFMFTMVGSAGAASFSDVTGTSVEAQAIYRLSGLEVLDGYPDGTFGPEKTITRAEFAKIACVTAGLKSVASGMGGTASPFSDVATDHWANGWVNVAAAQGFVKGDPAGTFRPEDQITQAEVVTVLLRLLGYNDNLPGEWPSDYISKAANLGVLDDVTFVATQAATRGTVAVLAGATLDENVVQYKASDNIFDEALKSYDKNDGNGLKNQSYTLLYDKFNKSQKIADAVLIYDIDLSDGKQAIKVVDPKLTTTAAIKADVDAGRFISYTLADGCVISGATSILGVVGRFAEYTLDKDDKVVSIEVKDNDDYKVLTGLDPDDIERVNGTTIKLDSGKSYEIAATFDTYSSSYPGVIYTTTGYSAGNFQALNALLPATFDRPADSGFLGGDTSAVSFLGGAFATGGNYSAAKKDTLKDYMEGVFLASETIDLVLDKDGKIAYVNCNAWPTAVNPTLDTVEKVGIVDRVSKNTGKVTLKNSGSFTLDADDPDNQVIIKNGKVVSLTDLAEDDMVWFLNKYNTDVVIAMSITATGKFDSYESTTFLGKQMTTKLVVGGKTYNVIKGGGYISKDEGDNYFKMTDDFDNNPATLDTITTDLKAATGGDATVYMSPSMTVAAILTGKGSGASSIYAVINDDSVDSLVNGKVTKSVEVMLPDGSFATYAPDKDSEIEVDGAAARALVAGDFGVNLIVDQFVQISLNSDGYIDLIKTGSSIQDYTDFGITPSGAAATIAGDKDAMTVTINGNKYDVSKAVIFNTSLTTLGDDDEVDIVGLTEFIDNADSTITGSTGVYAKVKKGAIEYFVFNNSGVLGSNNKLAMVTGTGTDSDGAYVKLMTIGDPVQYSVKTAAVGYAKGDVVNYNLSSGKVKINDMSKLTPVWKEIGTKLIIDSINGNIFKINGQNYSVDKDTLYFDYTGKNPVLAEKADFSADDSVLVYQEAAGDAISAIVLVK